MTDVVQLPSSAPNSLNAAWEAAFKGGGGTSASVADGSAPQRAAPPESPAELVSTLQRLGPEWAQLFTRIPADGKHRKDALGGAVKIRSAGKRLEQLSASTATTEGAAATAAIGEGAGASDGGGGCGGDGEEGSLAAPLAAKRDFLAGCQGILREMMHGFLELTFAVDDLVSKDEFQDQAAVAESRGRLQAASDLTASLAKLFAAAEADPKATAGPSKDADQSLPPEMLKMLEKCMDEQKGGASVAQTEEAKAIRAAWERGEDGLCSALLGEEIWEALCWRHGTFLFSYIGSLLKKDPASLPLSVVDEAIHSFELMLHAQGPIASDRDDPAIWQADSDGQHEDETARMFYHGVYSSSHLRALKFLAEICYWRWKHCGKSKADAEVTAVINRKFTHVVRHIIPGAGWTADVEYDRVVEVERDSLEQTSLYSQGLNDKPKPAPATGAGGGSRKKSGKSGGKALTSSAATSGSADGDATGALGAALAEGAATASGTGAAGEASRKKRSSKKK